VECDARHSGVSSTDKIDMQTKLAKSLQLLSDHGINPVSCEFSFVNVENLFRHEGVLHSGFEGFHLLPLSWPKIRENPLP
jgi:hypothetical protein